MSVRPFPVIPGSFSWPTSLNMCIIGQVLDPKVSVDLEAGRKLAASLLDGAIMAQASAENEMYPFLLVRAVLTTLATGSSCWNSILS